MLDTVTVNIPYPRSFLGLRIFLKKKVGFSFTNLSIFLFREANNLEDSDDYNHWIKENGQQQLINDMLYWSVVAYCQINREKVTVNEDDLITAIAASPEATKEKIMSAWKRSQTFGKVEEKKKVKKKKVK